MGAHHRHTKDSHGRRQNPERRLSAYSFLPGYSISKCTAAAISLMLTENFDTDVSLLNVASKILQGCVPRLLDLKSRTPSSEQGQIDMIVASKKMLEIRLVRMKNP